MTGLAQHDSQVEERLAQAVKQVGVLGNLAGQLEPQLERAPIGVELLAARGL